jgi:small subunit ribosomal protein S17
MEVEEEQKNSEQVEQGEADEKPSPKQLRKLGRSRFEGTAQPQRSPSERAGGRTQARTAKATARRRWRAKRHERGGAGASSSPKTAPSPARTSTRPAVARKTRQGVVVSNKADKTITVRIDKVGRHPIYGKVVRRTSTLHVHDERGEAAEGDVVRVVECRPLSKTKRWRLLEVVEKAR